MGTDKEDKEHSRAKSAIDRARADLDLAKANFLNSGTDFDPLQLVRKKPVICAGSAFLLGFGLTSLSRKLAWVELVPLLLQTAETASRLFINLRKN